jgi:hypothetical protein
MDGMVVHAMNVRTRYCAIISAGGTPVVQYSAQDPRYPASFKLVV